MSSRNRIKYTKLREPSDAPRDSVTGRKRRSKDDFYDDQFEDSEAPAAKPPVKSIVLAAVLLLLGSGMLTVWSLMVAGVIGVGEGGKATPILIIGLVCFVPGVYNVRTAIYAWKGGRGFSYADIPS